MSQLESLEGLSSAEALKEITQESNSRMQQQLISAKVLDSSEKNNSSNSAMKNNDYSTDDLIEIYNMNGEKLNVDLSCFLTGDDGDGNIVPKKKKSKESEINPKLMIPVRSLRVKIAEVLNCCIWRVVMIDNNAAIELEDEREIKSAMQIDNAAIELEFRAEKLKNIKIRNTMDLLDSSNFINVYKKSFPKQVFVPPMSDHRPLEYWFTNVKTEYSYIDHYLPNDLRYEKPFVWPKHSQSNHQMEPSTKMNQELEPGSAELEHTFGIDLVNDDYGYMMHLAQLIGQPGKTAAVTEVSIHRLNGKERVPEHAAMKSFHRHFVEANR